ncbi:hypothetical protein CMMCAS05_10375 [Clavibacter michiganensis subsp. michiganensis]|nr:hypothetical protein CMMCAS05_10375 [Clavibacter michiganensis subsp. michiganensis]
MPLEHAERAGAAGRIRLLHEQLQRQAREQRLQVVGLGLGIRVGPEQASCAQLRELLEAGLACGRVRGGSHLAQPRVRRRVGEERGRDLGLSPSSVVQRQVLREDPHGPPPRVRIGAAAPDAAVDAPGDESGGVGDEVDAAGEAVAQGSGGEARLGGDRANRDAARAVAPDDTPDRLGELVLAAGVVDQARHGVTVAPGSDVPVGLPANASRTVTSNG